MSETGSKLITDVDLSYCDEHVEALLAENDILRSRIEELEKALEGCVEFLETWDWPKEHFASHAESLRRAKHLLEGK